MLTKYSTLILMCCSSQFVSSELLDPLQMLCNMTVPSSVVVNNDTWTKKEEFGPLEDDLDRYVLQETGCEYESEGYSRSFYPKEMTYDGKLYEWRGAVRARDEVLIQVRWWTVNKTDVTYNFFVGNEYNDITRMLEYETEKSWEKHTPMILDMNSYVPFYLKIQEGILIFGKICDSEPMFTHNVSQSISRGDRPTIMCHSWSLVGGKFLYNCPAHVKGRSEGTYPAASALRLLLQLMLHSARSVIRWVTADGIHN